MADTVQAIVNLPKTFFISMRIQPKDVDSFIRRTLAVELYREGNLSLGKAAELAGFKSRWEMLLLLKEKKVPINYSVEELEEDIDTLKKVLHK
jgi:predicted HTH domain antitoxin